eukprot:CAMPEP_0117006870 /NCGR_PEP_ID=MMETSP0472-20121206/6950_1 /TAXON_ID=693140 ORGANISM="Tiarina fusus, Strain LIS" /NCGR_SAMPLE_ID=MMETSP0472 /ASSEMBLY_ACC=CAM_ASM_000603 /LENGTH=1317 /DNA_ID=CAMNT_0004708471 /DNA_START=274 /DNA_END=4227 /DNA_ORIENTATION=-
MNPEEGTEMKHDASRTGTIISVHTVDPSTTSTTRHVSPEGSQKEVHTAATDPTGDPVARKPSLASPEEAPDSMIITQHQQIHSANRPVDGQAEESSSVVSSPAEMNAATMEPPRPRVETDTATVASAPAVIVDSQAESSSDVDEFIASPHGNAIVERSPGGRYVRFMEKLGSGASKEVYRAYDTQEGIEVAWNVVHLAGVPKNQRNRIVNEVRLLESLHHHNIISFHGSWVNREQQQVNFVTEILSSGTLKSFINKVQVIRWKIAKRWAIQILKGLIYLHSQEPPVIHRDLKCENIFINGTSGDLRIGDLGLSTVHRNGKVLSVLGTPEFMAPDMYEENSYDEKVDIYAFGMCLLEIFTKEIPYSECSNPAQIYKRVSRGTQPESLKRLKSRHAREFIELCLGHKDEEGRYIRPSAKELLNHEFLQQRESDEDEVEVEPPMAETVIREGSNDASSPGLHSVSSHPVPSAVQLPQSEPKGISPSVNMHQRSNSLEEDESDRFDEMPDSEVNIRKVKVMMGRNTELEEDEPMRTNENKSPGGHAQSDSQGSGFTTPQAPPANQGLPPASQSMPPANQSVPPTPSSQPPLASAPAPPIDQTIAPAAPSMPAEGLPAPAQHHTGLHYLVAAAVIENEPTDARPYGDNILKLVVTLPVEGQTQNVQFDFHLVQDDAIQVAKEMVAELGIPQGAVLEISETVSGLARTARMKQNKYLERQEGRQGMVQQSQYAPMHGGNPDMQGGMMMQQQQMAQVGEYQNQVMPSASHQSMTDYMGGQQMVPAHQQHPQHMQQPVHQQGVPLQDQSAQVHGQNMGHHGQIPQMQMQQSQHHQVNQMQSRPQDSQPQSDFGQQQRQMNEQAPPNHGSQSGGEHSMQYPPNHGQGQYQQQVNPHIGQTPGTEYQSGPPPGDGNLHSAPPSYGNNGPMSNMQQNIRNVPNQGEAPAPQQHQQQHQQQQHQQQQAPQGQGGSYSHVAAPHMQMQAPVAQSNGEYIQRQPPSDGQGQPPSGHPHQPHMQMQPPAQRTQGVQRQGLNPNQATSQFNDSGANGQNHLVPPPSIAAARQRSVGSQQQGQPNVSQGMQGAQPGYPRSGPGGQQQAGQQQQPPPPPPHLQNHQRQSQQPSPPQAMQQPPQHQNPQQIVSAAGPASAPPPGQPSHGVKSEVNQSTSVQSLQQLGAIGALSSDINVNGELEVPTIDDDDLLDDDLLADELRKLDEDYRKNMNRAKKVFDSRMDNLQRTQKQRETQHLKFLERHEKERTEFEKRMQQEEIEQNRRIQHLQKEWDKRRTAVRAANKNDDADLLGSTPPGPTNNMPTSNLGSDGNRQ